MMLHRQAISSRMTRMLPSFVRSMATTETPLDASKVKIIKTNTPSKAQPNDQLVFGKTMTDHMLTIEWNRGKGWATPEIKPYAPLSLDPSCCVFHYGFELFEGLKAYRTSDDKISMFRPDMNMKRMNKSAARICLPTFESE